MKWETFRRLTPMQQQEWKFRFEDNRMPLLNASSGVGNLAMAYALMCTFLTLILLVNSQVIELKLTIFQLSDYAFMITKFFVLIWMVEYAYKFGCWLWTSIDESRWLKEATKNHVFPDHKPHLARKGG